MTSGLETEMDYSYFGASYNRHLLTYLRHLPTYLQPRDPHRALGLATVMVNQHTKYLGQKLFSLKVTVQEHTHTLNRLLRLDH